MPMPVYFQYLCYLGDRERRLVGDPEVTPSAKGIEFKTCSISRLARFLADSSEFLVTYVDRKESNMALII
jgi:hypothetical protein